VKPRDQTATTTMLVLPETVQLRSAPARPPEILFRTRMPGGAQAIEPAALAEQDRQPRVLPRRAARGSRAGMAREKPRILAKTRLIIGAPLQEMIMTQPDDRVGKLGSLALKEMRSGQIPDPREKSGSLGRPALQDSMS
jgi:hypothetical protein